jgi:hypothetical protein
MGFVERMRWWQWIALSLGLGALLGYINSFPPNPSPDHSSVSPMIFEIAVMQNSYVDPTTHTRHPCVSGLVIHPIESLKIGDKTLQYQLVTFSFYVRPTRGQPDGSTQSQTMLAPYPYEPAPRSGPGFLPSQYPGVTRYIGKRGDTLASVAAQSYGHATPQGMRAIINANPSLRDARGPADLKIRPFRPYWIPWNPDKGHTIADFLDAANLLARQRPGAVAISYHYAWWESPNHVYAIWMGGSFLLIGLIWPALLRLMALRADSRQSEDEQYLARFKSESSPPPAPAPVPAPVPDDGQYLRALEGSLEGSLEPSSAPAPPPTIPDPPAVKKLTAEPLPPPAPPLTPEEKKSYEGEFYPVARPGGPKQE